MVGREVIEILKPINDCNDDKFNCSISASAWTAITI